MIAVGNNGEQYLINKTADFDGEKLMLEYFEYAKFVKLKDIDLTEKLSLMDSYFKKEGEKYGFRYKQI